MNRRVLIAGILVSLPLVAVLFANLGNDPHVVESPLIGQPAPDFGLVPVEGGDPVRLQDLRGQVVLINFWATWCVPCFQEHAVLMSGARRWGDDARFLGVVYQDEPERVKAFSAQRGAAYPSLLDEDGRTAIAYGVYGVPETFFISPEGVIVDKYVGPLTEDALAQRLAKARRAVSTGGP